MNHLTRESEEGEWPVLIPRDAYLSRDYARAEMDGIWSRVWQVACREEEIPDVGDYVTYDILDESIIVVRSAPETIRAYYNVCQHRGRRLTDGCGNAARLRCDFHGWVWNLDGDNVFALDKDDWRGCLTAESLRLAEVKVDCWGGWVWINMDPACQSLRDYLEPAVGMLGPFEFDKMHYRWRQWTIVPCNWKTALEAFNESYHVDGSHPQLLRWGSSRWWCQTQNHCAWHGRGAPRGAARLSNFGASELLSTGDQDPRLEAADYQNEVVETLGAMTTESFVQAANRLAEELPEGTSPGEVNAHYMAAAQRADAERGVFWPDIDVDHMIAAGHDWHIFPNTVILFGHTFLLGYRARPNGHDPDSCIFEVYALERFPDGEQPETQWVHKPDLSAESWLKILAQDFANMPEVQRGMKSRGFKGARPGPVQELGVVHFHRLLARYTGTGAPVPLDPAE